MKRCVLDESKACDGCGACDRCDLDPNKICDNCCKCIEQAGVDYAKIPVMDVVTRDAKSYLAALEAEEEEDSPAMRVPYEHIDPALLSYWEDQLRDIEEKPPSMPAIRGVRKRKGRHSS